MSSGLKTQSLPAADFLCPLTQASPTLPLKKEVLLTLSHLRLAKVHFYFFLGYLTYFSIFWRAPILSISLPTMVNKMLLAVLKIEWRASHCKNTTTRAMPPALCFVFKIGYH
jgi:hypothetical protein